MRILDELKAYNGDLSYAKLINKIEETNNKENSKYHKGYNLHLHKFQLGL